MHFHRLCPGEQAKLDVLVEFADLRPYRYRSIPSGRCLVDAIVRDIVKLKHPDGGSGNSILQARLGDAASFMRRPVMQTVNKIM